MHIKFHVATNQTRIHQMSSRIPSVCSKTTVAICMRSPLFRGLTKFRHVEDEDCNLVPVIAKDRDFWPQSLPHFCPKTVMDFMLDDEGTLSWAVEVRLRAYQFGVWKNYWDHLSARGVESMSVLCAEEYMQLPALGAPTLSQGREFEFDAEQPEGKGTPVLLTSRLCAKYHPGLARRLSSEVVWGPVLEDLYAKK